MQDAQCDNDAITQYHIVEGGVCPPVVYPDPWRMLTLYMNATTQAYSLLEQDAQFVSALSSTSLKQRILFPGWLDHANKSSSCCSLQNQYKDLTIKVCHLQCCSIQYISSTCIWSSSSFSFQVASSSSSSSSSSVSFGLYCYSISTVFPPLITRSIIHQSTASGNIHVDFNVACNFTRPSRGLNPCPGFWCHNH